MKTRLSIIGTVGLPACYGGFETLAHNLVKGLSDKHDITVYCSGKTYKKDDRHDTHHGARLKYINLNANGVQSILYDTLSILHALFTSDVLLILGVSGAWILPFVRLFTSKRIIISIDGIEWKRAKWNLIARIYLRWAEKIAVRFGHIDISDNEAIQDYTAMRYGTISRVIEYGGDHVRSVQATTDDYNKYPFLKTSYAVKVCRIEPENNVDTVLNAFKNVPSKNLVIVGNWKSSNYGRMLKSQFNECPNITILDPIYEPEIINMIRSNAALYIHGHSAGGTNPSLVEAMFLSLPIISFSVSYNKVTTENQALYFNSENELTRLLNSINNDRLNDLGLAMSVIARRRYVWHKIIHKYDALIYEVQHIGNKTSIVPKSAKLEINALEQLNATHLATSKLTFEK